MFSKMRSHHKLFLWATILSSGAILSSLPTTTCQDNIVFPKPKPASEFEGLRECPQGSDELLNECIRLILEENRAFLSNGVPQIGLQPLDPLHIKEFPVPITQNIVYKWKNVEVRGFSKYSRGEVTVNTKKRTMDFRYAYPLLRVNADYERGGSIFSIPLRGTGKVQLDIKNYQANGTFFLNVVKNGEEEPILQIRELQLKNGVDDIHSYVPNLATGGMWGEVMNEFLDSNAKWIYEDFVRPQLKRYMEKYLIAHSTIPTIFSATYFINN